MKPLDFALRGGVVGAAIFLSDVESAKFTFELVSPACSPCPGEPGGEDHPVVGQC